MRRTGCAVCGQLHAHVKDFSECARRFRWREAEIEIHFMELWVAAERDWAAMHGKQLTFDEMIQIGLARP